VSVGGVGRLQWWSLVVLAVWEELLSSVDAGGTVVGDTAAVHGGGVAVIGWVEGTVGHRLRISLLAVELSLLSWRLVQRECSLLEGKIQN
jgi:hypothetical protein